MSSQLADRVSFASLAESGALVFSDGYRTRKPELGALGFPILRVTQIGEGRILPEADLECVRDEFASRIRHKLTQAGDAVLTTKGTVGRRARVRATDPTYVYSPQVCFFRVLDPETIDPDYLYFWLGSPACTSQVNGVRAQTDMADYVSLRDLSAMKVDLPDITSQRAIGQVLRALDDKIDVNRRIFETLGEIARALFTSWFVDFEPVRGTAKVPEDIRRLFPDRLVDSPIGSVPDGWAVAPISTVMTVSRDSLDPGVYPDELFEHFSLPAYDAGRNPANERGADIKSTKLRVLDGCILLSKLNPRIPRAWWPSASKSNRRIASTEFVVALPRDGITRSYLFGLFTSAPLRGTLSSLVRGTSGSHQRVGVSDLLGIQVVVPPPGIIERFDTTVAPMFEQQEALAAESKTLAELRDTLLPKLISGEVRLP